MTTTRTLILLGLAVIAIVITLGCLKPKAKTVTFKRMNNSAYQNFIINWDVKAQSVLYAFIQNPVQYQALFQPAAVNQAAGAVAPDAEMFSKKQILVVARATTASENTDSVFSVERIEEKNKELLFYYRYSEPKTAATWTTKSYLTIRIPRRDFHKVIFIENGEKIGELNTAAGQWSAPTINP